jgi:hypothetical protein
LKTNLWIILFWSCPGLIENKFIDYTFLFMPWSELKQNKYLYISGHAPVLIKQLKMNTARFSRSGSMQSDWKKITMFAG